MAVQALLDAYWTPQGWRDQADAEHLAVAVEAGLAFEAEREETHDGWVQAACDAVRAVSLQEVSDALVASLSSRRLDLRSALGSFAVARHLRPHRHTGDAACRVCGLPDESSEDLSLLSFERFKWGGVRRDDVAYVAFDLEQFRSATKEPVSEQAVSVGRELLAALRGATSDTTATTVLPQLRMVKGNKDQRRVLLEVLGVCGVLRTPGHPSYRSSFVREEDRDLPPYRNVDTAYPACWWRGGDGLDRAAVRELLPSLA